MDQTDNHLLIGCSFTDPVWQTAIPWSIEYSKEYPSYIVAKAGMGIKGIATEAIYYLRDLPTITTAIIVLPTIWRMDIEVDTETYLCNSMVDLLYSSGQWKTIKSAHRKWITSGGLHYDRSSEAGTIFSFLYKHQGFLVIAKEHFRALKILLDHCKQRNIQYYVSTIQDPMDQLTGIEYIQEDLLGLLRDVEYDQWFRFDGKFIDRFLGHQAHPTTDEHRLLCKYISDIVR